MTDGSEAGAAEYTGSSDECPAYDTKKSDGEVLFLEIWGMWSTPLLPFLPGLLWHGVEIPFRFPSMG